MLTNKRYSARKKIYYKITKNIKIYIFRLLNMELKNSLKFLSHQKIQTCTNEKENQAINTRKLIKKIE
jgi:hypothetical protein